MPKVMFPWNLENATLTIAIQPFSVRSNVAIDSSGHISVATLEKGGTIGAVGDSMPERGVEGPSSWLLGQGYIIFMML